MRLQYIISIIERETSLEGDLKVAKEELQTILDKIRTHREEFPSSFQIITFLGSNFERGKIRDKLKDLYRLPNEEVIKFELENCKKYFEGMAEIYYLDDHENHLLESINYELEVINLESEINQL